MALRPSERYTAVQACNHPWITRKINDSIPMTFEQKNLIFKKEMELNKVDYLYFFKNIAIKKGVNIVFI